MIAYLFNCHITFGETQEWVSFKKMTEKVKINHAMILNVNLHAESFCDLSVDWPTDGTQSNYKLLKDWSHEMYI